MNNGGGGGELHNVKWRGETLEFADMSRKLTYFSSLVTYLQLHRQYLDLISGFVNVHCILSRFSDWNTADLLANQR